MAMEPRRFFIVHLQKTAGTTLRDRFRATFDDARHLPELAATDATSACPSSRSPTCWNAGQARRDEIRVVAGHFPLSTVELLDADFVTLSVLRPPVERTLSYLRHQKKINAADRDRSLEEIYDDPFRFNGLIRNHMVRMFSIGADEMSTGDGVLTDVADSARAAGASQGGVARPRRLRPATEVRGVLRGPRREVRSRTRWSPCDRTPPTTRRRRRTPRRADSAMTTRSTSSCTTSPSACTSDRMGRR